MIYDEFKHRYTIMSKISFKLNIKILWYPIVIENVSKAILFNDVLNWSTLRNENVYALYQMVINYGKGVNYVELQTIW
jgi:hypothetical protein